MKFLGDYGPLLKNSRFLRLWLAQAISNFGDAVARIALMVLIASKTSSAAAISMVVACQAVPAVFLGPLAGVLVDRYNRKTILVACDVLRMGFVIGIALASKLWLVYLFSFLLGAASCFYTPARSALIPEVVGEDIYAAARSMTQSTYQLMLIAGPAAGGILVGLGGYATAFWIDALTFALSALIIISTALPAHAAGHKITKITSGFSEGIREILDNKALTFLLASLASIMLVAGGYSVLLVDYVNNVLGATPAQFGMVESLLAAGTLVSALVVGYYGRRLRRGAVIFNSMTVLGLWSLLFLVQPKLWAVAAWALVLGAVDGCADVPMSSLLVELTPAEKRGRIFGVYAALVRATALFGLMLAGPLAELIGTGQAIAVLGAAIALIGAGARLVPAYQQLNVKRTKPVSEAAAGDAS